MKTLIITAHPASNGYTHEIAGAIKDRREKRGEIVEILDLYKTDLNQNFLRFENPQEMKLPNETRDRIQLKMKEANEIIVIHPLWWFGPPAIMKNFLDNNITSPFAFHYDKGKRIPHLTDKTGRIYITCDGLTWIYYLLGLPFVMNWVFGIFIFCGIKARSFDLMCMMCMKTDMEKRKKKLAWLAKRSDRYSIFLSILNFIGSKFH